MKRLAPAALMALTLFTSACGNDSSPSQTTTATGTWAGSARSNLFGSNGSIQATLNEGSTGSITGTWNSQYPGLAPNSGTLTGRRDGAGVVLQLRPSVPGNCDTAVTTTLSGNSMTGTWSALNCTVADGGSISVSRQ